MSWSPQIPRPRRPHRRTARRGRKRPEPLQGDSAQKGAREERLFLIVPLERVDSRVLAELEGDDVVRLERAAELRGHDSRVPAVGAARRGGRRIADKFCTAGGAGVGAHVFDLVAPAGVRGLCLDCGFLFLRVQRLNLGAGVLAAAVVALEHAALADIVQRPRTGRALIICYLCGHGIAPFGVLLSRR